MEYQEIINLLDNKPNQLSKFKTKNWFEINDESRGTYNKDNQIRFNTSMLRSSLCDIVIHIYLLKELYQLETLQQLQQQTVLIKR